MSTSEHSDYGDFEKRLQEIFSDEKGDYVDWDTYIYENT